MKALRTNLFLVALGLSLLGLVMVYSATYREVGSHYLLVRAAHMALGLSVFVAASRIRYTAWRGFAPGLYAAVVLGLVLVLVPGLGTEIGGARRWFDLGAFSLQPSEFAKLVAVLTLSCALARGRSGSDVPLRAFGAVGLLLVLVFLEPDFDTCAVILAGAVGALWASEIRTSTLLLVGGPACVALLGAMLLEPYRRERLLTFMDPGSAAQGSGYQVIQSIDAIKSGDVFGAGVGAGTAGVTVPETSTDMIFTLIGQELGLLGMVVVIGAFGALSLMGFRIALSTSSVMARCLAAGITTMLAVQAAFNIGATMGVLPLAGMTLPFVSYGGSSMVVCFAALGILYRISEDSERAREAKPPRDARAAANPDRGRRYRGTRDTGAVRGG